MVGPWGRLFTNACQWPVIHVYQLSFCAIQFFTLKEYGAGSF